MARCTARTSGSGQMPWPMQGHISFSPDPFRHWHFDEVPPAFLLPRSPILPFGIRNNNPPRGVAKPTTPAGASSILAGRRPNPPAPR